MCFIPTRRVQHNPAGLSRRAPRSALAGSRLQALTSLLWLCSCDAPTSTPRELPLAGQVEQGGEAPPQPERGPLKGRASRAPTLPREGALAPLTSRAGVPERPVTTPPPALEVRALIIAEAVRRRTPVGVSTRFPNTIGHLWGLVEVHNPASVRQIRLRWRHKGELRGDFPFAVGRGLKWREWSRVLVSPDDLGEWTLELFDAERAEVSATSAFEVYAPGDVASGERLSPEGGPTGNTTGGPTGNTTGNTTGSPTGSAEPTGAATLQQSAVERLVVAAGVKHRLPVGVDQRFSGVERVWGYLEVRHSGPPTTLWMEWIQEGEARSRLSVKVAESERWRTWSWQRLRPQRDAGRWEVRVTTATGEVLATAQFIID